MAGWQWFTNQEISQDRIKENNEHSRTKFLPFLIIYLFPFSFRVYHWLFSFIPPFFLSFGTTRSYIVLLLYVNFFGDSFFFSFLCIEAITQQIHHIKANTSAFSCLFFFLGCLFLFRFLLLQSFRQPTSYPIRADAILSTSPKCQLVLRFVYP